MELRVSVEIIYTLHVDHKEVFPWGLIREVAKRLFTKKKKYLRDEIKNKGQGWE